MYEIIELDTRTQNIVNLLVNTKDYINISQMVMFLNVSKRSIYYDIKKVNDLLRTLKCDEVLLERGKGFYLSDEQKNALKKHLNRLNLSTYYQFTPNERMSIIICALIGFERILTIEQLIEFCHVSRNTIISDLKISKNELENYGLVLSSIRYSGYIVKGEILQQRAVFFYHFNLIQNLYRKNYLNFIKPDLVNHYFDRLKVIENKLGTQYVEGTLVGLAVLLSLKNNLHSNLSFKRYDINLIIKSKEYSIIKKMFPELERSEIIYISLHLLGSRVQIVPDFPIDNKNDELYHLAKLIVEEFQRIACIEFSDPSKVQKAIFIHLKTSVYRYKYGIQIENPITKQISNNYPELFEVSRRVSVLISRYLGVPIQESEIAYLTLHFGGYLEAAKRTEHKIRAILYSQDGISTTKLLCKEIEEIVPNIEIKTVSSIDEVQMYQYDYDIVISTLDIKVSLPMLKISPILRDEDRTMLISNLSSDFSFNLNQSLWDGLIKVVSQYVSPNDIHRLKTDIFKYIKERNIEQKIPNVSIRPSITDILNTKNVHIFENNITWEDSIRMSSMSLLNDSKISNSYVETILENIKDNGPYIYFEPGLAIAHSRPEDGVYQLGLSMGIFKKGVAFSDNLVANIVFVLAPIDHVTHLRVLNEMMDIFSTEKYFEKIVDAKNPNEVISTLNEALTII